MDNQTDNNGKFCLHCSNPLVGRQAKYCSDSHRQRHKRQIKKQSRDQTTESSDQTTASSNNAIEVFEQVKRDLARSEGLIVSLTDERDTIRTERDQALQNVGELQRENGALQAKIDMLEQQQKPKTWRDRLFRR